MAANRKCATCGGPIGPQKGGGRPRTKCEKCSPPRTRDLKRRAPHKLVVVDGAADEASADEPRGAWVGEVEEATRAKLEAADLLDDPSAMVAVKLAQRIDRGTLDTGAGVAALVREHRAALADAMSRAKVAADPLERLRLVVSEKTAGA